MLQALLALTYPALKILKPYLKGRVLQLGYQDLLASKEEIKSLFGVSVTETTDYGGWHSIDRPLVETQAFLEHLGCFSTCVDIVKARGCEVICDLNFPPDARELQQMQYDLVIDGGTLEHCFNIGWAMMTVASTVRPGGVIFHGNPMNWINHGFYCMSPTLFNDFYGQSGWKVLECWVVDRGSQMQKVDPTKRFRANMEVSNLFVAQRQTEQPLVFPTQYKYLKNPHLNA